MRVELSTEVWSRQDFALLANARELWTAVEVGVDRGTFARQFLSHWRGLMLWCVDPWESYDHMPWRRDGDFLHATIALAGFGDRVRICRTTSAEMARIFRGEGQSVAFVYVDGDHSYDAVAEDLAAWWPVVSGHGILAGHDYVADAPGVQKAVNEFAAEHSLTVRLTQAGGEPASWYCYKKEPAALLRQHLGRRETPLG